MCLLKLFEFQAGIIRIITNVSIPGLIHINTTYTSYSERQMSFAVNQTSQHHTYQAIISFMQSLIGNMCVESVIMENNCLWPIKAN